MTTFRIGLIVNPVAGIGGRLGWHGSDVAPIGVARSASPVDQPAADRAARMLTVLREADGRTGDTAANTELVVLTAAGSMGADVAAASEIGYEIVYAPTSSETEAADTRRAAAQMLAVGVDLIMFVGGDGTARDICASVGLRVPAIGVPAGVKMHSGVFGRTPESAASAALAYLAGQVPVLHADVVDLDEAARERGDLTTRLYGQLPVPASPEVQRGKIALGSGGDDVRGIVADLRERLKDGYGYVFGPGTTVQAVGAELGWQLSLLGVDAVIDDRVYLDVSAERLGQVLADAPLQVIVSPIGGQGMVLGRGNQPIDADVLARLDPADLLIVCTPRKLGALRGELYVDAPTPELNARFAGPRRVITGYRQEAVITVR